MRDQSNCVADDVKALKDTSSCWPDARNSVGSFAFSLLWSLDWAQLMVPDRLLRPYDTQLESTSASYPVICLKIPTAKLSNGDLSTSLVPVSSRCW